MHQSEFKQLPPNLLKVVEKLMSQGFTERHSGLVDTQNIICGDDNILNTHRTKLLHAQSEASRTFVRGPQK